MSETVSRPPAPVTLLERERELEALSACVAATAAGEAGLVVVEGPAGIGKSRLVGEARRLAGSAGLRVFAARGGENEREFPFGIVRQLFEPVLVDEAVADTLLAGSASSARNVFRAVDDSDLMDGDNVSYSVMHGLYWLTANLAGSGPIALAIDDLHWCDRPSLRFLSFLSKRLDGLPVLVVTSLRPSEPGADAMLLAELTSDELVTSLRPRALTEAAATALVRRRFGEDAEVAFAEACHSSTGGNPLLLAELLKALDADGVEPRAANVAVVRKIGPRSASRAVLLRLGRLAPAAIATARALAVLGECADLRLLAEMARIPMAEVADATAALARSEIVERDAPLRFVHPAVQGAVYHDLATGEREILHARAAELLAEAGASSDQVAAQQLMLPPRGDDGVVSTLRRAAADALRRGAPENAAVLLERALREPPAAVDRPNVLFELGLAEAFASGEIAAGRFAEALTGLTDPATRARASEWLVRMLIFTGAHDEGMRAARSAVAEIPPELEDQRMRLEALELYATSFGAKPFPDAEERLSRYREPFTGQGVGGLMLNAVASWEWALAGGTADECAALALHAGADGQLARADPGVMSVPVRVLVLAGRPEAEELVEAMGREAHLRSSVFASMGYHLFAGIELFHRGELVEALEKFERWRLDGDVWEGNSPGWPIWASHVSRCRLAQGDLAAAQAVLERVEERIVVPTFRAMWKCSVAEVRLAYGRLDEALELLEELADVLPSRMPPHWVPARANLALVLDRLGRSDEALAVAREGLEAAQAWGAPAAVGAAQRLLGTLERADGIPRLEEAVSTLESSPARYELALALAALGASVRRDRRPTDAREPLRRALELAEACGAHALVAEVRSEISATGARPRSAALTGTGSLTASEKRVAAMAAEGLANREIAQALYVTPKTVEVHLSSVYRKLRIGSRRDLTGALAG